MIDVLVVGAGPTGLTMALECARYGLSCRIIDSAKAPMPYSRAIAIQARTLEIFQRMGIHRPFLEQGLPIQGATIHSHHKAKAHLDFSTIPSPFPFVLSLEQNKTESILTHCLLQKGISLERETELLTIEEHDHHLVANTTKGSIQAHYIVGCDGAHSCVRKQIGCTFQGKSFPDLFSLADVHIDWERPHNELSVFLEKEGIVAALPLPEEDRYRIIFRLDRLRGAHHAKVDPKTPDLEEIQNLLTLCTQQPLSVSDPRWITNFHINSRLSSRYRKGNLFLAGDAAHIHSPVGGQGMNTGIQDAFNLAWKLAYVHLKGSNPRLLDTYEQERRGLGKQLLKATELASTFVSLHSSSLISLRNILLSKVLSLPAVQKRVVAILANLRIGYPDLRVPNYPLHPEESESTFFSATEGSTQYHLLSSSPESSPHPSVQPLHVKGPLPSPILVRPDGYPTKQLPHSLPQSEEEPPPSESKIAPTR